MRKIVVIDEDECLLDVIEVVLAHKGFKVITGGPRYDNFDWILLNKPDLLILDYLIDGIKDGELCSIVKRDKRTRHIPVIVLTGYGKAKESLVDFECDIFMRKPINFPVLVDYIYKLLNIPPPPKKTKAKKSDGNI